MDFEQRKMVDEWLYSWCEHWTFQQQQWPIYPIYQQYMWHLTIKHAFFLSIFFQGLLACDRLIDPNNTIFLRAITVGCLQTVHLQDQSLCENCGCKFWQTCSHSWVKEQVEPEIRSVRFYIGQANNLKVIWKLLNIPFIKRWTPKPWVSTAKLS